MANTYLALLLLVVGQFDDEVPQRLPIPDDQLPSLAVPAGASSYPGPSLAPSIQQPQWNANDPTHWSLAPQDQPMIADSLPNLTPEQLDEVPLPGTRFTFATMGTGGDFGATSLDFNHTWLLGYGEGSPVNITPGLGMHWWTDPAGIGLPSRVYDLYVDFQWTPYETDLWRVTFGFTPGIYTDFSAIGGKAFQLTGWLVANRQLGPHWQVLFGAAYVRQLQSGILPVGGLIWTPHDDLRLELIFPKPKFAMRFRETSAGSLWWYVSGQLGGGAWAVDDPPGGSALVTYNDLRLALGIEAFRVSGNEWSVELAYLFDRHLYIDNAHVVSPGSSLGLMATVAY